MRWLVLASVLAPTAALADELPELYDLRRGLKWVAQAEGTPLYVTSDDPFVMNGLQALKTNTRSLDLQVRESFEPVDGQCWLDASWADPSWTLRGGGSCAGTWGSEEWAREPLGPLEPPRVVHIMGTAALGQVLGVAVGAGTTLATCGSGNCGAAALVVGGMSMAAGSLLGGTTGAVLGGGRRYGLAAGLGSGLLTLAGFGLATASDSPGGTAVGGGLFLLGPSVGAGSGAAIRYAARPVVR